MPFVGAMAPGKRSAADTGCAEGLAGASARHQRGTRARARSSDHCHPPGRATLAEPAQSHRERQTVNDVFWLKLGACALIVWGLKLIVFGGTKTTGSYFELFGFEFGTGEREPMGTFECWFIGLALIAGGGLILKHVLWG